MKHSVIVCTYNAPRELDLVLCGLARQTRAPDEVLIADDGSTEETAQLVAAWAEKLDFPLLHVWHEDKGFRKTRITNEAVRRSTGDQLIFLDGDSVPHRKWVHDHDLAARPDRVLCGRRVKLGPRLTSELTRADVEGGRLEARFGPVLRSALSGDTTRWGLSVRLPPPLARFFHLNTRKLMGVNFSLPRTMFEAVNGYDETQIRREDRELELRLIRSGFPLFPLLNRAIVYHLHHEVAEAKALDAERVNSTRTRCEVGLDNSDFSSDESPRA